MLPSIRSKAAIVLLSTGLLIGAVTPLAAAPSTQIASGGQTHPFECYKDGNYYPLGTKLSAGPEFYWKCEMGWVTDSLGRPHYQPVWNVYPKR